MHRHRRLRTTWIAVAAGVMVTSGCAAPPGGSEDPTVVVYDGTDPGFLASQAGDLVVEDGCVGLVTDDETRVLLVFPKGVARWEGDHLQYGDVQYAVGDRLDLTGGVIDVDDPAGQFADLEIFEACADWQLWSVTGTP